MDEELKRRAYLEAHKLQKAGYDAEVILARLDKMGIPEKFGSPGGKKPVHSGNSR